VRYCLPALIFGIGLALAGASTSATSSTLVFASARAAGMVQPAVYTIGIDGRGRRRVTPGWDGIGAPNWSPTGSWIAFERNAARTYVVPSRGGRPIPVGRRTSGSRAAWSPDGSAIAMLATRDVRTDLLVARTGQWQPRSVVRNVGTAPAWFSDSRRIAYSRGGRAIRVVDTVTGDQRLLLRTDVHVAQVAVSPDGTRLAYTDVSAANEIYDLYVADLRSGKQRRIARGLHLPAWSPDGRWIAARTGGDSARLDVIAVDGRARFHIARLTYDETPVPPAWSPDGSRLLVTRYEVHSVRRDGHAWRRITHERPGFDLAFGDQPAWSPNGRRVAYTSMKHQDPDLDLYEIPAGGGRAVALTANARQESDPAWSPDGSTLAFTRRVGRVSYVIALRGRRGQVLAVGAKPAWSPDGRQLAFVQGSRVYLMSSDGTGVRAVTSGPDDEPDWSPDGTRIAFVRRNGFEQDIWSVDTNGSDLRRMTEVHAGRDRCVVRLAFSPAWSPDGSEIAYSLLDGGNLSCGSRGAWQSIEAVAADGSRRTRLITDGGRKDPLEGDGAYEPSWSPDGRLIAFRDDLARGSRIAVVPSAGGRFRFVTPRTYDAFSPDWRP